MAVSFVLALISAVFSLFSGICCAYHFVLGIFGLKKSKIPEENSEKLNKFSAVICARNEEKVIGNLVKSLKAQNYGLETDVIVVADNCTDSTALVARQNGARVFERNEPDKQTKGYALSWLFDRLFADSTFDSDAVAFFDADNVVESDFVSKMNSRLNNGERIIQGYRDTKNPESNWISGSYAVYFMIIMRFCNTARYNLGMSAFLGGTGFVINSEILRASGWHTEEISEDIEYSIYRIAEGEKITFAREARFYDEQPTSFSQSWHQRVRWGTGMWNTFKKCVPVYIKNLKCLDGLIFLSSVPNVFLGAAAGVFSFLATVFAGKYAPHFTVGALASAILSIAVIILFALFTVKIENKDIKRNKKGILGFPVFLVTFMAASVWGIIHPVKRWVPVEHKDKSNIEEIRR